MTILVTGATGFVGMALTRRLQTLGRPVLGLSLRDADLSDTKHFQQVSHLVHLAAKTYIPDSWSAPAEFYRVNTQGTANVLELCRRLDCGLTFVSSYIYGPPQFLPITESHPLEPNNPYSHSKKLAEELCEFFAKHFEVPVTILRPFNIYGPGQRDSFLIPTIVRSVLSASDTVVEVMDLEPRRDWIFVEDVVDAIVATLGRGLGGTYNVASGRSVSVAELIQMTLKLAKVDKPMRSRAHRRPDEILDLYADITRIHAELGWSPRTKIEDGLAAVVAAFDGSVLR